MHHYYQLDWRVVRGDHKVGHHVDIGPLDCIFVDVCNNSNYQKNSFHNYYNWMDAHLYEFARVASNAMNSEQKGYVL